MMDIVQKLRSQIGDDLFDHEALFRSAADEIERLRSPWSSDLEAAPKDGKLVLVWHPTFGLHFAHWEGQITPDGPTYWRSSAGHIFISAQTLWMYIPLPGDLD